MQAQLVKSQRTGAYTDSSGILQNLSISPSGLKYMWLRHGNHIMLYWNKKGNIKGTAVAVSGLFHQNIGASVQGLK